ncbi:hypothetical protein POM88_035079 [Heracleum sosnowskyi]|uniref:Uncharacterized protein n=1 Tax=Heracleum sosnowskyi TaxID=360622 RepID=A0AAD8MDM3_9APIA|nr:hypothetical protein POM88_035079 [Heracleum sosnowskyi]
MNFRRKPTEKTSRRSFHRDSRPLHPEDFDDVFGGPPRTVSFRQFDRSDYFYDDIFRNPVRIGAAKSCRKLPEFQIPAGERDSAGEVGRRSEEFCADFLRMDFSEVRRSRSRSKSNSSSASVLSTEEYSPFRPPISDDDFFSPVYASKLRPIHGQLKRDGSTMMHGVQQRRASSPESMSRGAYSYSSVKVSVVDEDDYMTQFHNQVDDDDDDDEISSSYVIEINSSYRERTDEGVGVDEAIAWAKESYQSHSSPEESSANLTERSAVLQFSDEDVNGCKSVHLQGECPNKVKTEDEQRNIDEFKKMELLEEDIKLWSSGKERNIELLLSTLHDILWPNSGWYPIALTNLYESSHVKKAYQKARLCLHPDKLQQRSASLLQKYMAEKIFPILQEAWAAYISQDIIISARG